ncbi:MAG: hypothetical protein OSB41_06810 [Kiritimatiellae bacterium]|nr:hypothetical protein [Kiritimatiellia bacterium]
MANENYLITEQDLSGWSAGLYMRDRERDVRVDNSNFPSTLDETRVVGYIGYRLFSWVTVYVHGGQSDGELNGFPGDGPAFGGTAEFNLMSHLIKDPGLQDDRIRVHSTVSYTSSEAESGSTTFDYSEIEADLTVSLINELEGNKAFLPQAIGLTAGGLLSSLQGDLEEDGDTLGYSISLDLLWTEHITIHAGVESLDNTGAFAGVHLAF